MPDHKAMSLHDLEPDEALGYAPARPVRRPIRQTAPAEYYSTHPAFWGEYPKIGSAVPTTPEPDELRPKRIDKEEFDRIVAAKYQKVGLAPSEHFAAWRRSFPTDNEIEIAWHKRASYLIASWLKIDERLALRVVIALVNEIEHTTGVKRHEVMATVIQHVSERRTDIKSQIERFKQNLDGS